MTLESTLLNVVFVVYRCVSLSLLRLSQGALHMQEQLQWPVIPVTIRGAYELFPNRSYYNQCGKVSVESRANQAARSVCC